MSTFTIELPDDLASQLAEASERAKVPPAQIIRESLERTLPPPSSESKPSRTLFDAMNDVGAIGCIDSGIPDLATNPKHLEGFGKCRA